jgi:diguanylate cyclase (GGDEF)-like protein
LTGEKGNSVASLLDPSTGLLQEEAFLHLLLRETGRATRYRDFFSLCLFKPDVREEERGFERRVTLSLSRKMSELLRVTDLVGPVPEGLGGILLLHTDHLEAVRIAERIRAAVRRLEFRLERGPSLTPVTISAGTVSFPRDGQTSATLLSRAERYLQEAQHRGGDSVVHSNHLGS